MSPTASVTAQPFSRKVIFALAFLAIFALAVVAFLTLKGSWSNWRDSAEVRSDYTQLDSPIGERTETNLVSLDDGYVFQWAGRGDVNDGVIFNPTTDTFEQLPAPPDSGRAAASTVWTGEEIIVWGGTSGKQEEAVEKGGVAYEPAQKQWRTISDAPVGLSHAPAQLINDQILVAGSNTSADPDAPTSLLYDLETDSWEEISIDVHIQTMFNFDGRIIGAGQLDNEASSTVVPDSQLVEFDIDTREWKPIGPHFQSQRLLPFMVDGQIGAVSINQFKKPIQALVLSGNQWTVEKELSSTYTDASSFYFWATWTGEKLLFSGSNEPPVQYDPSTNTFGLFDQSVDFTGPAVWNGNQLVALSSQTSRGWTLKPTED